MSVNALLSNWVEESPSKSQKPDLDMLICTNNNFQLDDPATRLVSLYLAPNHNLTAQPITQPWPTHKA